MEYVGLELAILAKEKGFDLETKECYAESHEHSWDDPRSGEVTFDYIPPRLLTTEHTYWDKWISLVCYAPTQIELHKWIRETREVNICIYTSASGYLWNMEKIPGGTDLGYSEFSGPNDGGCWDTWEEAMEHALLVQLTTDLEKYGHWGNYAEKAIENYGRISEDKTSI